jgi:predicted RNA-binding Zn-ribbon protein involved in translation (DUF1610 family)
MMPTDVTDKIDSGEIDGECLPITKCVCGEKFDAWSQVLSIYPGDPWVCPNCGVKLIFRCDITVYQL